VADVRIRQLLRLFGPQDLPVTWWTGPMTQPADLADRLEGLGLVRQPPEFAMSLDVAGGWPPAPLPAGATLEAVEDPRQLDEWLGIMNAAYGWPDARKTSIILSIYLDDLSAPAHARETHHFLVRLHGRPAACSSLFVGRDAAFVTNIGTHPDARGLGLGTAATVATLELARELGRPTATLAASVHGRGVYRRLGFVESGVLDRYVATAETIALLDTRDQRGDSR
jgi:GNAT superfamily N-acetyltransferase